MGVTILRQNYMEADAGKESRIFGEEKIMSWITVYISGTEDFREEVRRKLEHSDQRYLQGYIESEQQNHTHDLFWLDDHTSLREFKEAISAKLIWKYRLRFFTTLEDFLASQEDESKKGFTLNEQQMIRKMQYSMDAPIL